MIRICTTASCFLAVVGLGEPAFAQAGEGPAEITWDAPVTRDIGPDEVHRLKLSLEAGQFAYVSVVEEDIDLGVMLIDPNGAILGWYDAGARDRLSPVTLFAANSGDHWLHVHARDAGLRSAGRYTARLERLEPMAETRTGRAEQWLAPWAVEGEPGVSVGVSRHGETLLLGGYGTANIEHDVPITAETVFHTASISKQVVAFAVQLLVEQGVLSLDEDVRTYLPWVPDLGHRITLRHLMHHTHGLPGTLPRLMLAGWRVDDAFSQDHVLDMVRRQSELYFEPGAEYMYTNTGHELLVEVVEAVTGESFRDWSTENVFAPLEMENTVFRDDPRMPIRGLADGYYVPRTGGLEKFIDNFVLMGGLGLHSTVEDLLKWMRNLDTGVVGGSGVRERMHERGRLNSGAALQYASGLEWGDLDGRPTVSHGGGLWPLTAFTLRLPEEGLSVVVLSNRGGVDRVDIALRMAEIFLGETVVGRQAAPEGGDPPEPGVAPSYREMEAPVLEDYVGRYSHPDMDEVEVFRAGALYALGRRWVSELRPGDDGEAMTLPSFPGVRFVFHRDAKGAVSGFTLVEDGESAGDAQRIQRYEPAAEALSASEGSFRSDALESTWTFEARDGTLVAMHRRHEEVVLTPIAPDRFRGPWFMQELEFRRNAEGGVIEISISGERVRDERFVRLP